MRYALPAIAVDEEEYEQVQNRIIPVIVQRLGFNRHLPTAIQFGPVELGGLGLYDLRTEGGIEMIKYFRNAIYTQSAVGELLILQLKCSQLEAGIPNPILEEPTIPIPYITPTWITSMRQYLSNHNVTIQVTDVLTLSLASTTDEFIMSKSRLMHYSVRQQKDINLVRVFLQVTTIDELTDSGDNTQILIMALQGKHADNFVSTPGWPRQRLPASSQIRLWKKYLSSQFLRYDRKWKRSPRAKLRYFQKKAVQVAADGRLQEGDDSENLVQSSGHYQTLSQPQRRLLSHVKQCVPANTV